MRYILATCLLLAGCGGDASPTSPTAPPPLPLLVPLTGVVTVTGTTVTLSGATVTITDGLNAGRSTTSGENGIYRFLDLQPSNGNVSATAPGWTTAASGTYINGTATLNFAIQTIAPWSRGSTGNTVLDKPIWVQRLRVSGRYAGRSSNFIVWCGTNLVVNELLGTSWGRMAYDGTHATPSCREMRIENSTDVTWTLAEVR